MKNSSPIMNNSLLRYLLLTCVLGVCCILQAGCARSVITITATTPSKVLLTPYKTIFIAPFLARNNQMGIEKKCAEELVYAMEHAELQLSVIEYDEKTEEPAYNDDKLPAREEYIEFWKKQARDYKVDLLIYGFVEFNSSQLADYETRTVYDPRTGRSRQIRRQVIKTSYFLGVSYYLVDLVNDQVIYEKNIENTRDIRGIGSENNIYMFFDLLDKSIEKFMENLKLGKRKLRRFVL